ncbi:MAG: hypothetical protein HZA34_03125 [Candidatus Pacebacteria bacterium]|nr:hypothetical protein [Candidatus Paceibacterota bacterium]
MTRPWFDRPGDTVTISEQVLRENLGRFTHVFFPIEKLVAAIPDVKTLLGLQRALLSPKEPLVPTTPIHCAIILPERGKSVEVTFSVLTNATLIKAMSHQARIVVNIQHLDDTEYSRVHKQSGLFAVFLNNQVPFPSPSDVVTTSRDVAQITLPGFDEEHSIPLFALSPITKLAGQSVMLLCTRFPLEGAQIAKSPNLIHPRGKTDPKTRTALF